MAQVIGQRVAALPPTVQALLTARLEQLEPSERALLGKAAVVGQIFYQGALEAAGKSAARSVGSGIGRAILRGALGSILRSR